MSDELACPRCSGHGFLKGTQNVWSEDFKTLIRPAHFPECRYCEGTGVVTEDQCQAYYDARRG